MLLSKKSVESCKSPASHGVSDHPANDLRTSRLARFQQQPSLIGSLFFDGADANRVLNVDVVRFELKKQLGRRAQSP